MNVYTPLLTSKKNKRKYIRGYMRGYRLLKNSNKPDLITIIKNELSETTATKASSTKYFFNNVSNNEGLVLNQFLMMRIDTHTFSRALLYAYGTNVGLVFPMPTLWQDVIEKYDIYVNRKLCSILWVGIVGLYWTKGIKTIFKYIYKQYKTSLRKDFINLSKYAYFDSLTSDNIPTSSRLSYDIVTWYTQWPKRLKEVTSIYHNVENTPSVRVNGMKIKYRDFEIAFIEKISNVFYFIAWGIGAICESGFFALIGKWKNAILLSEYTKAMVVRLSNSESLAREYWFHPSYFRIYRPIWTYEAERKGSEVIFYFYSTNTEPPKGKYGYLVQPYNWDLMSWPKYLVWDNYQKNFVKRAVGNDTNIEVVGDIWFSDASEENFIVPGKYAAIFDIQPRRDCLHQSFGIISPHIVSKAVNQFLIDIYNVLRDAGIYMAYKRKRKIDINHIHIEHEKLYRHLYKKDNIVNINPNISATRIINNCEFAITYPFSSTAIIAANQGKPSVYYDPLNIIQKNDRAAHGISVLHNVYELRAWVMNTLS